MGGRCQDQHCSLPLQHPGQARGSCSYHAAAARLAALGRAIEEQTQPGSALSPPRLLLRCATCPRAHIWDTHRRQASGRAARQQDFVGMLRHRGQRGSLGAEGAPHRYNLPFQSRVLQRSVFYLLAGWEGAWAAPAPRVKPWFFIWSAVTSSSGWTPGSCLSVQTLYPGSRAGSR